MDSTSADFIIPLFNWGHNSGRCIALIGHAHAVVSTFLPGLFSSLETKETLPERTVAKRRHPLNVLKFSFDIHCHIAKKNKNPFFDMFDSPLCTCVTLWRLPRSQAYVAKNGNTEFVPQSKVPLWSTVVQHSFVFTPSCLSMPLTHSLHSIIHSAELSHGF